MIDETDVARRTVLRAITAASGTALSLTLAQRAAAQPVSEAASTALDQLETAEIDTGDNTIFIRRYGKGSPLLMVHGFPRTSLMWRHVAPQLASRHTVICVDLRGYGRSGVPASAEDHCPYSKRAMGNELVAVMDKLGFSQFDLVGHDRGGRVSYASHSTIRNGYDVSQCLMSSRSRKDGPAPMQSSRRRTGPGSFCPRRHRFRNNISWALPVLYSIIRLDKLLWSRCQSGVHRNVSRSGSGARDL